jgi:hypothetical protein
MNIAIRGAELTHRPEEGYAGKVQFEWPGHQVPYEITLSSKDGKDWGYSLMFSGEPGTEEEILQVEDALEEDDELFDVLIDAAMQALNKA